MPAVYCTQYYRGPLELHCNLPIYSCVCSTPLQIAALTLTARLVMYRMGLARLLLGLKLEELMLERCSDILQASAFVAVASLSNLKVISKNFQTYLISLEQIICAYSNVLPCSAPISKTH